MEVKLAANCIYMVDRVDILTLSTLKDQSNILLGRNNTRQTILERRGDWFCEELVDAFMDVSVSEAFWFCLESEHVNSYTATWVAHDRTRNVQFQELLSLVRIFSTIVDAKSPFTREHSQGVANLARHIGEQLQLPKRSCEMLELAGLLHDLGKLRVPDDYLEKPGKLTAEEYSQVQRHSFDTFNVLKNVHGLEEIAQWAAQHHERVDGSGYPYHLGKTSLSLEARIVAVADVFQALAQKRPYRDALPPEEVMAILKQDVAAGKLDPNVVAYVQGDLQACWTAALAGPGYRMA
jgi:HD-GYP domain-containing protein (c-di-GMP phosphodiesterase class II)